MKARLPRSPLAIALTALLAGAWGVGCSSSPSSAGSPAAATIRTIVGSYQDPNDPVNGVAFAFTLDGHYTMALGSKCGGTTGCAQRGTFVLDVPRGQLHLHPDSGGEETLPFSLTANATGRVSTQDAPLASADAGADCLSPSDPLLTVAAARVAPVHVADNGSGGGVSLSGDGGDLLPGADGGALSGEAGAPLASDAGVVLTCIQQIPAFTIGPVGDGGALIAGALPGSAVGAGATQQKAIDYNQPGTCPGAVGPNCSLRTGPGWPIGNTCDKVAGSPTEVECDVSIGSLAHDTCCGQYPNGKYCNGPGPETTDCTEAWNRAQSDYASNNYWRKRFTAGVPAHAGWNAVNSSNSESTYWSPSNPDFSNDGLCISNTSYGLSEGQEASFCCSVPGTYSGHCN